ncbi:MAG: dual OB domain-containing protein [Thermomicrobiales bacterium]
MARRPVIITDLTRMGGERVCIAGYVKEGLDAYSCVRPLFRNGTLDERWLYVHGDPVVRPFAVVELDFVQARPQPPHTEDWHVAPGHRERIRLLDEDERWDLLTRIDDGAVSEIFGTEIHHEVGDYLLDGQGSRSLGTIFPARVNEVVYGPRPVTNRWEYRIGFEDQSGRGYRLTVTDLAFRYGLDHARTERVLSPTKLSERMTAFFQRADHVALRIGLARGWEKHPERCYLQITGVYTRPDYLSGRCHADFHRPEALEPLDLADVPF